MDRRLFMARMVALAGSLAAAEALIGAIAASPAAAAIVPADDKRLTTRTQTLAGGYQAYVAEPRTRSLKATVLVIHENRGLNEHTRDVARRLALAGFRAVAPDLLSLAGGTPANEDAARDAIGKLDLGSRDRRRRRDARRARQIEPRRQGRRGRLLLGRRVRQPPRRRRRRQARCRRRLLRPGPDPAEAAKVAAPLMIHHAGLDARVAQTLWPWIAALRAAGKPVTYFNYEGANHAFNNDTSAERYNKAAADLAWKRTLRFFRQHLGG